MFHCWVLLDHLLLLSKCQLLSQWLLLEYLAVVVELLKALQNCHLVVLLNLVDVVV